MTHLFTVEDRFEITNRGLVLAPKISSIANFSSFKKMTAKILLRKPDGTEIRPAKIAYEYATMKKDTQKTRVPVLVLGEYKKDAIPIGTEVFLLSDE
jgi:hypothetical protein